MANTSELNNYIVSFGGCDYTAAVYRALNLKIIDCSDLSGTHLYCDDEAGKEILSRISREGIQGIHFIDTGDYHYVSRFMADLIQEPFVLVQIDHHTDMQETAFGGLLSCGSWVGEVLRENPNAAVCLMAGPPENSIRQISGDVRDKVTWLSEESMEAEDAPDRISSCLKTFFTANKGLPVYISVDKDVLERKEAVTDWDQGKLSLEQLCRFLDEILSYTDRVIGVDICGGTAADASEDYRNAQETNEKCDRTLYDFFVQYFLLHPMYD